MKYFTNIFFVQKKQFIKTINLKKEKKKINEETKKMYDNIKLRWFNAHLWNFFLFLYLLFIAVIALSVAIVNNDVKKKKETKKKKLTDDELYNYINDLYCDYDCHNKEKYTLPQLVVISIMTYTSEIHNGGLCQFFVNSSREFAPVISDGLEIIKAPKHKELYDSFIKKNKIDVNNLESFISNTYDEFINQYKRYPFEKFDKSFYKFEETEEKIEKLLIQYTKENYKEIVK